MIQDRVTIMEMCTGIADTLRDASELIHVQNYDELTESIPDTPLAQIYWVSHSVDTGGGTNDRTTFKAEVRQSEYVIFVDLYASPVRNFSEDMQRLVFVTDEMDKILEAQDTCPPFGIDGCKGFRWDAERNVFNFADANYVVAQYTITLIFH